MAYRELGIKIVQQFTGAVAAVTNPLLPECIIGPAFNIQTKVSHSTLYDGAQKTVAYPNLDPNEYVDLGTAETWGDNEVSYPVRAYLASGTKITAAGATGYFASDRVATGTKANAPAQSLAGFPVGSFNAGDVGKKVYIHTGDVIDVGERTISAVNAIGTIITLVAGVAFNTLESVTVSVLPTSGKVKRFYSPGNLANAQVGDYLQIAPTYPTSFLVVAVDIAGNYVEVSFEQNPTASPTGWRLVVSFTEFELTRGTNFTADKDNVYVDAGIVETTTPAGIVLSATIKVSYRALKTDLALSTGYVEDDTDIVTDIGLIHEANPLALSLSKAIENTTTKVYYAGVDISANIKAGVGDFDSAADYNISEVLDRLADEDVYVLSLLSQEVSHHSAFKTHIVDTSSPNGIYNRVRVGLINRALVEETSLQSEVISATWDVRGVTEVVSAPADGTIKTKDGRLYSRGSIAFPDFDGTVSPLPVNPLTDMVRLSGGSDPNNDGWWKLEQSERLPVKNPALVGSAPYWGYVAAYNNRIRSCVFRLTASDSGAGVVRLTAPLEGAFDHITPVPPPNYACIAYIPTATDGIRGEVTGVDPVDGKWVDTDITWDANFAGDSMSQISISPFDDVFKTPGLTATAEVYTVAVPALDVTASPLTGTRYTAGVPGSFDESAGNPGVKVGNFVEMSGSATVADNGYFEVLAVDPGGDWIDIDHTSTLPEANPITVTVRQTRVAGGAGLNEFLGLVAGFVPISGCSFRYAGRNNILAGNSAGAHILTFAAANLWGQDDVGREVRIDDGAGVTTKHTIVTVSDAQTIVLDGAVIPAGNYSVYLADNDYVDHTVRIFDMDLVNGSYVIINESWSQIFAGTNLSSLVVPGVNTFGYGDSQRVVSPASGAYAGQTGVVQGVRPNELAIQASLFTSDDITGFGITFSATPGNNCFRLKERNAGAPVDDAGKVYSIERDFRYLVVTGESFTTTLLANDVIRINAPSELEGDYIVDAIISDSKVRLKTSTPFNTDMLTQVFVSATPVLEYELIRPNTKDEQAEAVSNYAAAIAERRMILVWPDICEISISGVTKQVPGYHIGSIIGALISGLPPQQPMSRLGLVGVEQVLHNRVDKWFNRVQMNTIAEGGVLIVEQIESTDIPYIRHQLTTDTSDVKHQEVSITKSVDYIDRIVRQEFNPYIGKYNINDPVLSKLRNVAGAIVSFVEGQNDPNAGPLVNEMRFEELDVSEQNADEVVASIYLDMPIPLNNITFSMYI